MYQCTVKYLVAQCLELFQREERRRGVVSKLNISLPFSGLILKRIHNVSGSNLNSRLSNKMVIHLPQGDRCWKPIWA